MKMYLSAIYQNRLEGLKTPPHLERNLRRADDFIRLAVVAAFETLQGVKEQNPDSPESYGLILGTAFGTMQTNFDVLDSVVTPEPTSPTLFSHSVFNAAGGYVASILNLQGSVVTVTDFSLPFFKALQEGYLALASGRLRYCLIIQVETYSQLLEDARKINDPQSVPWQPGVVCWLLQSEKGERKKAYYLEKIEVTDKDHASLSCLQISENVSINNEVRKVNDPLGAVMAIGAELQAGTHDKVVKIEGALSEVSLCFRMRE